MKKFLTIAIMLVMVCFVGTAMAAVEGYNPDTCPDGPFDSSVYFGYCDYTNFEPGVWYPAGTDPDFPRAAGYCYDSASNTDCTPIDQPPVVTAEPLVLDSDMYIDEMYEVRTFDGTHPDFGLTNTVGGWQVGATIINPERAGEIGKVEIIAIGGVTDGQVTTLVSPDTYSFQGTLWNSYDLWIGNRTLVAPMYEIVVYGHEGNRIPIQVQDLSYPPANSFFVYPETSYVQVPVSQMRKMAITKNKGIRVKFTTPFDPRDSEIRIRILDETGIMKQFKEKDLGITKDDEGHYFFVKNDGTVVLDKIRVFIPMEYAGMNARVEYRIYEPTTVPEHLDYTYMLRGTTMFQLPAPEPVVEEVPEVTVEVECSNGAGLSFVVDGVCTCPAGFLYFEGFGCM